MTLSNTSTTHTMPAERLFQTVQLGRYTLPYRIVMAPLTRSRALQPAMAAAQKAIPITPALLKNEARHQNSTSMKIGAKHIFTDSQPDGLKGKRLQI